MSRLLAVLAISSAVTALLYGACWAAISVALGCPL